METKTINQSINKTKYKVLFNSLLCESKNTIEGKRCWSKGYYFTRLTKENPQLNKYLMRI